jgi:hypothetical protein
VVAHERVAHERLDGLGRGGDDGVRVLAEEDARDRLRGEERGLRALRDKVLLRVGLSERQLRFGKRGAERDVCKEFEHAVGVGRERGCGDGHVV